MKVIDLLNKIAKGEKVPKKIRIDHWCYKFEWVEHLDNYYDESADIDLMSVLSMSKEELNYEVKIIKEEKDIEPIKQVNNGKTRRLNRVEQKINELVREVNKLKRENEK